MYFFFVVERGYLLSKHSKRDLSVRLEDHMFFSHVRKILEGLSFHPVAHLVFHWGLYNKISFLLLLKKEQRVHYEFNILLEHHTHPFEKLAKLIELKPVICLICC